MDCIASLRTQSSQKERSFRSVSAWVETGCQDSNLALQGAELPMASLSLNPESQSAALVAACL